MLEDQIIFSVNFIKNLSHLGLLCISGEGAYPFLQGQLTCDLDDISEQRSQLAAHCNPQGRIISLFRIFMYHNAYYLQMPQELIAITIKALQKYAIFFKVQLTNVTQEWFQIGYQGRAFETMLKYSDEQVVQQDGVIIIKLPGTPLRYLLLGPTTMRVQHQKKWNIFLKQENCHHSIDTWKAFDIKNKIPAIYPETTEKFLPHELNLPQLNAISFQKGCYTGQEIIARMQYRGKLKTTCIYATIPNYFAIKRGEDIYNDQNQPCGSVVDYCLLNPNQYALLIIKPLNPETTCFIDSEKKIILQA